MAEVKLVSSLNIDKTPVIRERSYPTSFLPRTAPAFVLPPRNSRVSEGSTARIDGKVGGYPDPRVTWYRRGQPVVSADRCIVEQSARGTFCLIIKDVTVDDGGKYTCEAANEEGVRQVTIELTVEGGSAVTYRLPGGSRNAGSPFAVPAIENRPSIWGESPPKFVTKPTRIVVKEGQTGRFMFKITGRPPPTATWCKADAELRSGGRYDIYDKAGVYVLEIRGVGRVDAGIYTCAVTNGGGSSAMSAELVVQGCDGTDGVSPGLGPPLTSTNKMAVHAQVAIDDNGNSRRGTEKMDPVQSSKRPRKSSAKDESNIFSERSSSPSTMSVVSSGSCFPSSKPPGRVQDVLSPPLLSIEGSGSESMNSRSYTKQQVTGSTKNSPSIVSHYISILDAKTQPSSPGGRPGKKKPPSSLTSSTVTSRHSIDPAPRPSLSTMETPGHSSDPSTNSSRNMRNIEPNMRPPSTARATMMSSACISQSVPSSGAMEPSPKGTAKPPMGERPGGLQSVGSASKNRAFMSTKETSLRPICQKNDSPAEPKTTPNATSHSAPRTGRTPELTQKLSREHTKGGTKEPTQKPTQEPTQTPYQKVAKEITQNPSQELAKKATQKACREPTQKPSQETTQELTKELTRQSIQNLSLMKMSTTCKPDEESPDPSAGSVWAAEPVTSAGAEASRAPQISASSITLRSVRIQPEVEHSRSGRPQSGETLLSRSNRVPDGGQQRATEATKAPKLLTPSSLEAAEGSNVGSKCKGFEASQFAPRFVKVLKSRNITEGEDLVLSCIVHGDPRPEISWLLNDQPIQFARSTYDDQIATLTVQDALPEDRGVYTCVAQNSCGSSSCRATVTVTERQSSGKLETSRVPSPSASSAPVFVKGLCDLQVMDGSQVVMNVEVTALPPAEILWFHNGKEIQETEDFHFERSGGNVCLYIQEVFPEDTGTYTCKAWNSLGQARTEAMLTVQEPQEGTQPWFISKPKSMALLPGQSALLSCAIAGDPFPEVHWMKDGRELSGHDVLQNEDVFTLILRNVHREDAGVYEIVLRNAVGACSCQVSVVLQEDALSAADSAPAQQREQPGFSERDGFGPDNALKIGEVSQRADTQESIPGVLKRSVEVKEHTEENLRQQEAAQLDFRNLLGKKVTTRTVSEETLKDVSAEQMDFRANLQRQVKPKALSEDERKVNMPQQVDFRAVLGKKTPVSKPPVVEKVQAKPATSDFRSLLGNKKKAPTENGNANSTEPHENAKLLTKEEKVKPLIKDEKTKPAVKEESAKPVVNQEKGKPLLTQEKAKPSFVKDEKLKPAAKEENVKTLVNQEKAKPLTTEEIAKPVVNQEKVKPLTKEENAKPVVNQEKAKSLIKEENAKPVINQEKAKMSVKDEIAKPALNQEKANLSTKEEKLKPAAIEASSKPLGKEDALKPSAVEVKPKPAAKEEQVEQNCVSVVDGVVENKATLESAAGTPPVFSKVLQDTKLVDGEKLVLQCRVTSEPPPTITWTLDGKVIKSSKFIVLAQEGPLCSLTIEKSFPEDGGQYRCAAENSAGKADCTCNVTVEDTSGNTGIKKIKKPKSIAAPAITSENEGTIKKKPAPKTLLKSASAPQILQFPEDRRVQAGESVELFCKVAGTQPISCMWMKFRKEIKESEFIKIEKTEDSCKLTISSARQEHCGCYTLLAENKHGSKQAQINLTVFDKPDPPAGQPCASEMKGSALTLSWYGPTYDGGSVVQSYTVEIWDSVDKSWSDLPQCRSTSYHVENLLHDREYKFRVRATNVHGTSEPSQESEPVAYKEKVEEHKDEAEVSDDEDKETEPDYRDVVINTAQKVADFYDVEERLGTGKFGQVFRIVDKKTKKVWAGKFLKAYSAKDKESIRQEIDIMNCLHHPKLVQCVDAFESKSDMVMVLELVSGGELFERIIDEDFELSEREVIKYMKQIAEGVEFIHKQGIVHLDLKPENIMCVNKTGTKIKLIDFGLARRLENTPNLKVLFGTPEFVAPEVINYEPIGYATDMWSIGVICYILVSGLSPFMGDNDNETLANVTSATWDFDDEAFDEISEEAKTFIGSLLKKDMRNRLNCTDCLQHTWLQQDTSTMEAKKLSKERMKKYMARRKWQKTGHAVRAIGRLSSMAMISGLSGRKSSGSAPTSPLSTEAEGTEEDNQAFLESVSEERPPSQPVFTRTIMDIEVVEGSAARFDCRIEGHPDPEVIWYKDDQPIKESRHFQIEYDEDGNCSLTIAEVCGDDDAKYTCKASNSQGEASCKAELLVEVMAEEEEEEEEEEE